MLITDISFLDIILSIIYVVIILLIAYQVKPKSNLLLSRFFIAFVYSKIIFAIIFVLIHVYYYKGGDTFLYFYGANFFSTQIIESPIQGLSMLFQDQTSFGNFIYTSSFDSVINSSNDVFFLSKLLSIIDLFSFQQYMTCNIIYTLLTSIGLWKLFVVLCKTYPNLTKHFAYGILFYPSLGIWGSGILKDPLTLCCVGLIFWSTYNLVQNRKKIQSILFILFSGYLCFVLKPYILYTFIPIMLLWTQGNITKKLKNPILKVIFVPILLAIFSVGGYFGINTVSAGAGKYSLESVQSVAEGFHSWHTYLAETRDQSGYSLGEVEYTISGILEKAPAAIFVTYYRPFIIGDVRNIATLFEAIQALILLLLTLYILIRVNPINFLRIILFDTDVRAFMLFALLFGIAIGLTSYNFGALSRYKIPSLPFFIAALAIIYYKGYLQTKKAYKLIN